MLSSRAICRRRPAIWLTRQAARECRAGLPNDIRPAASLLADDNRWINAQRIEVSGGMFV